MATKISRLPFEELPNLPRPIIPTIELQVEPIRWDLIQAEDREDENAPVLRYQGVYSADQVCQTEYSELRDVKEVAQALEELSNSVVSLRKDLGYAQSVMKAEYESKIVQRAIQLHHVASIKLSEVEKEHKEKLNNVRQSYRMLLNNSVKRIGGGFKDYYEDLLSGKTDRHDLIIRDLKERVAEMEAINEEQQENMTSLQERVTTLEAELAITPSDQSFIRAPTPPTPPPPSGISDEEADKLRTTIDHLRDEVSKTRINLGRVESANTKLTQQVRDLSHKLEDEQRKTKQMKKDIDVAKSKAKADKENTEMLAKKHLKDLEREMEDKMATLKDEARRKADRESELQQLKDQSRQRQELARQKGLEEQLSREKDLRANIPKSPDNKGLLAELEKLKKVEAFQRKEIERLNSEAGSAGKTWEIKLAIMQKNFRAFKDEAFVRKSLQRQSAQLHHAAVSYAVDGMGTPSMQTLKPPALPRVPGDRPDRDMCKFSPHKPLPEVYENEEPHAVQESNVSSHEHAGLHPTATSLPATPRESQKRPHRVSYQ